MGNIFDNFNSVERLSDPEERKVEDLKRSKKRISRRRNKKTSFSMKTVNASLIIVTTIAGLLVAGAVAYGIYFGIQLYLNGWYR